MHVVTGIRVGPELLKFVSTYRLTVALLEWWTDSVWTGCCQSLTALIATVTLTLILRWCPGFSLLESGAMTHIYISQDTHRYQSAQELYGFNYGVTPNLPSRALWYHWYWGHSVSVHTSHSIHLNPFPHNHTPENKRERVQLPQFTSSSLNVF